MPLVCNTGQIIKHLVAVYRNILFCHLIRIYWILFGIVIFSCMDALHGLGRGSRMRFVWLAKMLGSKLYTDWSLWNTWPWKASALLCNLAQWNRQYYSTHAGLLVRCGRLLWSQTMRRAWVGKKQALLLLLWRKHVQHPWQLVLRTIFNNWRQYVTGVV